MELLERYLRAVKSSLPPGQRDDIISELSENLRSQIEDRQAVLGRSLTEADLEAILQRHGHPTMVASRYGTEQRSLAFGRQWIGPPLFPLYAKVLSISLGIATPVGIAAAIVFANGRPLGAIVQGLLFNLGLQFAIVSAIFILANRSLVRHPDRWRTGPFGLPQETVKRTGLDALAWYLIGKPYRETPRLLSMFELAVATIALLWWRAMPGAGAGGVLRVGPAWQAFYLPSFALLFLALAQPAANLIRPRWARFRSWVRAGIHAGFAVLFAVSLRAGDWILLADPAGATGMQRNIIASINRWAGVNIAVMIAVLVVLALLELRRAMGSDAEERPGAAHDRVPMLL